MKKKRDFYIWHRLGLCTGSREQVINDIFNLPNEKCAASVALAGMPAAIYCREHSDNIHIYENATMTIIDGMHFVKLARKKGFICERCAAPDIMGPCFKKGLEIRKKHFFYGCTDEVLARIKENLERDYPGIEIVGMYSPPFRPLNDEEDRHVIEMIQNAQPDFLWVGLGGPKQEIWMQDHCNKLKGCTMLGVGAGFNFIAGTLGKAPKWIENASLEWMYRFIKEPKRLFRRNILGAIKYFWYSFLDVFYKNNNN